MTIEWNTYKPIEGTTYFDASELAGVTVLRVIREGLGFNRKRSGSIGDRGFRHTPASGRIEFLNPFLPSLYSVGGIGDPGITSETIYVRYKY